MLRFVADVIFTKFCSLIASNEKIREALISVCADYYRHQSLHVHRVWGDSDRLKIGENVHLNNAILNTVSGDIEIGDNVFFGHSVSLLTGTHDVTKIDTDRQTSVPTTGRDITIGKGVWIASNAIVLGPCVIGDHAVIGAGSVVNTDVPPYAFFAGTPAKLQKTIKPNSGIPQPSHER